VSWCCHSCQRRSTSSASLMDLWYLSTPVLKCPNHESPPPNCSFGGGDNTTLQYYEISGSGGVLQPNGTWTGAEILTSSLRCRSESHPSASVSQQQAETTRVSRQKRRTFPCVTAIFSNLQCLHSVLRRVVACAGCRNDGGAGSRARRHRCLPADADPGPLASRGPVLQLHEWRTWHSGELRGNVTTSWPGIWSASPLRKALASPAPRWTSSAAGHALNGGQHGMLQVSAEKGGTDALAFLKPFAWQLWLAIAASMLGIAFMCWLLSRLSPMGRYEVRTLWESSRPKPIRQHLACSAPAQTGVRCMLSGAGVLPHLYGFVADQAVAAARCRAPRSLRVRCGVRCERTAKRCPGGHPNVIEHCL
jgi:hypothetical protein